ncbi:Rieske 2Fe-2S domain-containing protein [Sulfurovum sp. AR]|uniref:Rieske 2Fe-2S domain-containing protein n=1 Tax=Sulfurovum sp. AR TaxID=1165841 RepID=UPI00025C4AC7|nr:Rieske 2Fe-2S domain-containing protein [Sulfurovum sp. AR]EIF50255.1 rieske (2fe-2S) iron-sulfur domain protein [Sulfurovum sp. AR]
MERRNFLRLSATSAMAVAIAPSLITQRLYAEDGSLFQPFEKVQLKDAEGNPIKASALAVEENYVFNYPYVGTPAIMVNLTSPAEKDIELTAEDGTKYIYRGGVGVKDTIVAYSAICPHQLTHPQPEMSMFHYIDEKGTTKAYSGGAFVCMSHLSRFEPKQGGKVVGGPATQGLASIILEVDAEDNIWAVAVLGPVKFQDYFDAFKDEFKKFYGNRRKAKKLTKEETKVQTLKNFSADIIRL